MTSNQPTTDAAEHERRVEAWRTEAMAAKPLPEFCQSGTREKFRVVGVSEIQTALDLMRSRPQTADGDLVERARRLAGRTVTSEAGSEMWSHDAWDLVRGLAKCEPRPVPAPGLVAAAKDVLAEWDSTGAVIRDSGTDRGVMRALRKAIEAEQAPEQPDIASVKATAEESAKGQRQREAVQAPASGRLLRSAEWAHGWLSMNSAALGFGKNQDPLTELGEAIAAERERKPGRFKPSASLSREEDLLHIYLKDRPSVDLRIAPNIKLRVAAENPDEVTGFALPTAVIVKWLRQRLATGAVDDDGDAVMESVARLAKERDEWKAKAESAEKRCDTTDMALSALLEEARKERDGWEARTEKAEAELADVKRREATGVELLDGIIADLRAKLEKAEQNSGDAKLDRLRDWVADAAAPNELSARNEQLVDASELVNKIDRLLSETPQPETEAPINLPSDEAEFLTALSDPSQQERTVKLGEAPSEPVAFDDDLRKFHEEFAVPPVRVWPTFQELSCWVAALSRRELARQSAKGAK